MLDIRLDLDGLPVVEVPLDSLRLGFSPRLQGRDDHMVRILAESPRPLPPILVHEGTNRVIDGTHRLLAARLRGERSIAVRRYACDEATAFLLAVGLNVAHGLPLSLRDRKAAAHRILGTHGHWSDRRIASATGLSDKTVGVIRAQCAADPEAAVPSVRIGLDGRARPVDAGSRGSRRSGQAPGESGRGIAPRTGTKPAGGAPRSDEVPTRFAAVPVQSAGGATQSVAVAAQSGGFVPRSAVSARSTGLAPHTVRLVEPAPVGRLPRQRGESRELRRTPSDPYRCLRILMSDPALRSTDAGRTLLRALSTYAVISREQEDLVSSVPHHDLIPFGEMALANAELWRDLASSAALRQQESLEGAERLAESA